MIAIWNFIKKYWECLLGLVVSLFAGIYILCKFFLGSKYEVPSTVINSKKNPTQDIDVEDKKIDDAQTVQVDTDQKAMSDYDKTVATIETQYDHDSRTLSDDDKKQIQQILDETHGDPDAMTKRLSDLTGIPITIDEGNSK